MDLEQYIVIHSGKIKDSLPENYTLSGFNDIAKVVEPALWLTLTSGGFLKAATRIREKKYDPTHYDAVWVRDSMWGFLSLRDGYTAQYDSSSLNDSHRVLRSILRSFATPKQIERLRRVIKDPSTLAIPNGSMNAIHIRFNSSDPDLGDVYVDEKPQHWNHKQNDALGIFFQCAIESILDGNLDFNQLTEHEREFLHSLPAYFEQIKYWAAEDAGCWEEIERLNTSSVALVTSSLECLLQALEKPSFNEQWNKSAKALDIAQDNNSSNLQKIIDQGYGTIFKQLPFGESPNYPMHSPKYRASDAALLNVLYPAKLIRLNTINKKNILELISPLIGAIGIKRYMGDSYQSGNYWLNPIASKKHDPRTGDYSEKAMFLERKKQLIENTEAQWFFDSWLSKIYGSFFQESSNEEDYQKQKLFLNRSLGQITDESSLTKGADGLPVSPFSCPESYNVIIENGQHSFLPSPITPLNWAKASLNLALKQMQESLKLRSK